MEFVQHALTVMSIWMGIGFSVWLFLLLLNTAIHAVIKIKPPLRYTRMLTLMPIVLLLWPIVLFMGWAIIVENRE